MNDEDYIYLWESGMKGKVVYCEDENTFQLSQTVMNFGLCEPLWEHFEGKRVLITIKVWEE